MSILVSEQECIREVVFCIPHDIDLQNKNQIKHYEVRGYVLYIDFVDEQRKSIEIECSTDKIDDVVDNKKIELAQGNEWEGIDYFADIERKNRLINELINDINDENC